ncbi:hypothetical protein BD289DRAFT_446464 [Coniella lustricola]|uniref:Uncharacterized protein n=1 Tax=Coniella lustricola TaxID=2025994 RepID=A0A2T2ZTV4_9PEZI|nr:hypothetical protein BD289DRAFT_446464 [Coniella lustricola]
MLSVCMAGLVLQFPMRGMCQLVFYVKFWFSLLPLRFTTCLSWYFQEPLLHAAPMIPSVDVPIAAIASLSMDVAEILGHV